MGWQGKDPSTDFRIFSFIPNATHSEERNRKLCNICQTKEYSQSQY